MELRIAKALEHRRLKHEIDYLRHTQPDIYDFDRIVAPAALCSGCSISFARSPKAIQPS